jgi:hypothetical protein
MNAPESFQMAEGYAIYRPIGNVSIQEAISLVSQAITFARNIQIRRLLVDSTKLTGFGPLGTVDRYKMGEQLADAGRLSVRLAMVARAELIDPQRFGVMVARNRGLDVDVFTSEAKALAWLLDLKAE